MGEIAYVVVWYLMVVFIGVISLPITVSVCRSLPDTGHSVSKILGILFLAYISWILSYVIGYNRKEIILSLLIISFTKLDTSFIRIISFEKGSCFFEFI